MVVQGRLEIARTDHQIFVYKVDIINHRDINLISLFNNSVIFFIINIYLDKQQNILKYLKDIEVNIYNVLIITGDFDIRDNDFQCDITCNCHKSLHNMTCYHILSQVIIT